MAKEILLSSPEELKEIVTEAVREELATFFSNDKKSENHRYLTRKETAEILGISLPTLHSWVRHGTLEAFRIGNSVRFKSESIEQAVQKIQSIKYLRNNY